MTPTSRTLHELRKRGYQADTCEKWLSFPERKNGKPTGRVVRIRKDLFGFADIAANLPGQPGALLVQACVTGDQSKRLAKIYEISEAAKWLQSPGNQIQVWGWSLRGARGERKTWQASVTTVRAEDCQPVERICQEDSLFQTADSF